MCTFNFVLLLLLLLVEYDPIYRMDRLSFALHCLLLFSSCILSLPPSLSFGFVVLGSFPLVLSVICCLFGTHYQQTTSTELSSNQNQNQIQSRKEGNINVFIPSILYSTSSFNSVHFRVWYQFGRIKTSVSSVVLSTSTDDDDDVPTML